MFIMIDGIDGSGKSLQSEMLIERLKQENYPVEIISFPQYGKKSAGLVEEYLTGVYGTAEVVGPHRASIFYAIDRFAAALEEGKIVVANRYVASNMGHQGGKITNDEERQKFFEWNDHLEYNIFAIPRPDLNIILHVTPEISQELVKKKAEREYLAGGKTDIHETDINHLRNAGKTYLEIARSFPNFALIDCVENEQILPPET
ncbi:MAG: thymidylate kinase, partial [Candidatus Magasanikbacteria bacterium]|nr:thymidylate kinase [Candidatus Magasanikbacteria bacterium]